MEIIKILTGPIRTNCYVINADGESIVIDPGGEAERISEALGGRKLSSIVLTHYHFDHHLACLELKEKYPAALLCIHESDSPYLPFTADRLLREGDIVRAGDCVLEVVHTPGHSPGGICLLGKEEIFTGDTLFADGLVGRTDLPGSSPADMEDSLQKLAKLFPGRKIAYPGHGRVINIE